MSVSGPLLQVARGQLALVENGDGGDCCINLGVNYGVVLNAEAAITRFQRIDSKSDPGMHLQGFEAFSETAHVHVGLARTEPAARVGPNV